MTTKINLFAIIGMSSLCLLACNANNSAPDAPIYDRIDLQASAVQQVNNDELEARMFVEKNASNPKTLTQQINPMIAAAIETAKAYPDVKLSTANQRSTPNYNYKTNKIDSWSMRSELRLISTNFSSASELIGVLQDKGLQVSNISFRVSDAQRQQVENQLITQVTDSFKQRAEVAKESWGAKDFKLVHLSIKSNTNVQPMPYEGDASYAMTEATAASSPAPISGGEQRIEMVAQGAVELIN